MNSLLNEELKEVIEKFYEPELIEVGEFGDTLRLYKARLYLADAKDEQVYLETGVQRLKTRATNLLGWVTTLSVASFAALQYSSPQFRFMLMVSFILYTTTSMLCVYTLATTKWHGGFLNEVDLSSELEYVEQMTFDIKNINKQNEIIFLRLFRAMRMAWVLFAIIPTIAAFITLFMFFGG